MKYSSSSPTAPPQHSDRPKLSALKEKLLDASLRNVPLYGWTQEAVVQAVQSLRPGQASLSLVGLVTPNDMVHYAMDQFHTRLQTELTADSSSNASSPSERIQSAIQRRLSYQREFIQSKTWHQAMALGASPDNVLQTREQLQRLVELIVQHAYANAEDHTGMTTHPSPSALAGTVRHSDLAKFTLGGVYVATELHMLTDSSPDFADTWAFLRQRIQEWEHATAAISSSSSAEDAMYVPVALGSAMVSGVASVLLGPSAAHLSIAVTQSVQGLTDHLVSSLMPQEQKLDATDPRFYSDNEKH